jgi:hypothetical protein
MGERTISFRPRVLADLDEAFAYYAAESEALLWRFVEAIDRTL